MTTDGPDSYFEHAALIHGWAAYCFANILTRHYDDLEGLPGGPQLEDGLDALKRAGEAWAAGRRGNAEAPTAESGEESDRDEVRTAAAAMLLNVTERRVRQLVAAGQLTGRRTNVGWWLDRAAVLALANERMDGDG